MGEKHNYIVRVKLVSDAGANAWEIMTTIISAESLDDAKRQVAEIFMNSVFISAETTYEVKD